MPNASTNEITLLLERWQGGDRAAEKALWSILYPELKTLASSALRRKGGSPTLQTTDLVNEACVRLLGRSDLSWPSRGHFFAFAAKIMRRVLVDHARRRLAAKRRGEIVEASEGFLADPSAERRFGVLEIDQALSRLSEISPRSGSLVELRFFGGLSVAEAAQALDISRATAVREWSSARAWLYGELQSVGG